MRSCDVLDFLEKKMKHLFALLVAFNISSSYAAYDISKTTDWKWHAYICKNAVIHLSIVSQMQEKWGKSSVDSQEKNLKQKISETVLRHEKEISFDQTDARLIADLVFSIRVGLLGGGFPLNPQVAANQGFDICVSILQKMDNEIINNKKEP